MKPEFKMQVDELLEALEQSKLLECDFTEITHADNSKELKCSCEGFMRRVADIEKQRDVLLAAMIEAREALQFANDNPDGGISDTIRMMHRYETLFDFMDEVIANAKGGAA